MSKSGQQAFLYMVTSTNIFNYKLLPTTRTSYLCHVCRAGAVVAAAESAGARAGPP